LRRLEARSGPLIALLAAGLATGLACRKDPRSLTIALPYEVDSLDPHAADRLSAFAVLFNAYEGLVDVDADLRTRAALAVTWESPDPLTWIFHLRPGVTFHSGRRLRAADVVYSFERVRRDAALQAGNFAKDLAEVEAVGELSVRVKTHSPCRVLLAKLRHIAIVPEGATAKTLELGSDGTGPYALAPGQPRQDVVLRRHAAYWGNAPPMAEARLVLGRSPEQAMAGLHAARYQLVKCDSRGAAGAGRFAVKSRDSLYLKYLAFDLVRDVTPGFEAGPNPFRDPRVRRAVSLGIDRGRLATLLTSDAHVATQPIPRAVFGFDAGIAAPALDREGARALLREAGFPDGFQVVFHARPFARDAAPAIGDDLRQVGIRTSLRFVSDVEHFELLARKGVTLWLTRIGCATGDASELFEDLIHTPVSGGRFGSLNDGGYSNPRLDAVIERSVAIEEPAHRLDAFHEITRAIMADTVIVPLYIDRDLYALAAGVAWEPRADSEMRVADIALTR